MKMLPIMQNKAEKEFKEYLKRLEGMSLHELVKEFISYLDYVESSDLGTLFHPVTISSSRVMMSTPLAACLLQLRSAVDNDQALERL